MRAKRDRDRGAGMLRGQGKPKTAKKRYFYKIVKEAYGSVLLPLLSPKSPPEDRQGIHWSMMMAPRSLRTQIQAGRSENLNVEDRGRDGYLSVLFQQCCLTLSKIVNCSHANQFISVYFEILSKVL